MTGIETAYKKTAAQVNRLAGEFCERNPHLDRDEVRCQARLCFVEAYHTYDPTKAALTTWVRRLVVQGLSRWVKSEARRRAVQRTLDGFEAGVSPAPFRLSELLESLSPDAQLCVKEVLDESPPIHSARDAWAIKRQLAEYLTGVYGWTPSRVRDVFRELRGVVSEVYSGGLR